MLSPELRDAIVEHARGASPNEACGLIAGRGGVPTRIIRCANTHPQPTTRYLIDPREQLRAKFFKLTSGTRAYNPETVFEKLESLEKMESVTTLFD